MSARNVLLGVVAGAAAGALLGVLLAPAKGSVTRKRIARRSADYAKDAKETFNEYIDALADEYETVKGNALDWVDKGIDKAASLAKAKLSK
jgi:gas vesicle protein